MERTDLHPRRSRVEEEAQRFLLLVGWKLPGL